MKLKIKNPTAPSFHEAVGISEERSNELSDKLDGLTKKYLGNTVQTCDLFSEIALFCDNLEEVIYCTINHCNFMMVKFGIILCPPKQK